MKSCSIYLSHMPSFSLAFSKFWVCKLVITSKWNLKLVGSIVQNSESKLLGDMIWIFLGCYLIVLSKVWKPEVYLWKTKNKVPQWNTNAYQSHMMIYMIKPLHICCLYLHWALSNSVTLCEMLFMLTWSSSTSTHQKYASTSTLEVSKNMHFHHSTHK